MSKEISSAQRNITKIFHIADIHISRYTKRHNEFKKVFHNFYRQLDTLKKDENCILIICGDLLHNKDSISNEQVMLTRQFLEQCGKRMPVYLIAGNHDLNMINSSRLDSITPIVDGLENITYFNKSGYYLVDNLAIVVNSLSYNTYDTDDDAIYMNDNIPFIEYKDVKDTLEGKTSLCLFHGTLNGSTDDKNFCFSTEIKLEMLRGYDYVLLGDIHKHQYLAPNIAYSGSLLQNTFGESLNEHGFICWDLKKKTSRFHRVENEFGLYTLNLYDSVDKILSDVIGKRYLEIRIAYERNDVKYFGDRHKIHELVENICSILQQNGKNILDKIYIDNVEPLEDIGIGLSVENRGESMDDLVFQNSQICSFCRENEIGTELQNNIIEFNTKIYHLTHSIQEKKNYFRHFRLKKLYFKNVYSYEEGPSENGFHVIDFNTMDRKVIGIIGKNHVGKSSILDIILFVLFDKCSRGKKSDILCRGKKNFEVILEFFICGRIFSIAKKGLLVKSKTGESVRVCPPQFKEISQSGEEISESSPNHSGNDRNETTNILRQMMCEYDDLVFTSFLFQNNFEGIIEQSQSEKIKYFQRILKIDQFERQCEIVRGMLSDTNKKIEILNSRILSVNKLIVENKCDDYDLKLQEAILLELEDKKRMLEVENISCFQYLHPSKFTSLEKCNLEFTRFMEINKKALSEFSNGEHEASTLGGVNMETIKSFVYQIEKKSLYCENKIRLLERSKKFISVSRNKIDDILHKYSLSSTAECISYMNKSLVEMNERLRQIQDIIERKRVFCEYQNKLEDCKKRLKKWESLIGKYDPDCIFCRTNFEVGQKDLLEIEISEIVQKIDTFNFAVSESEYEQILDEYKKLDGQKFEITNYIHQIEVYNNQTCDFEWNERIDTIIENVQKEKDAIHKELTNEIEVQEKRLERQEKYKKICETKNQFEQTIQYFQNDLKIKQLGVEISSRRQQYDSHEKKQVKLEELCKEKSLIEQELSDCRVEQNLLENYIEIFGKSGIPVYLYKKCVPSIENLFNSLSERLNLPFKYTIKLDESKNIYIYLNMIPIEICSGFEKFITSLFMRLSIQKLHYFKSNFIFIDEGFSNIDSDNLQKLPQIFEILKEYFDNIFIVTHDSDVRNLFDANICVERNKLTFY